ncbi:hypothetical protein ACFYOG_32410 [Streptomyces sp. NPDC007818]|uniref:hypothetical protein n=1 Tax=Streptomyces sp. NPDC007818 TaxID=3364780 RepID=UPI0036A5500D
MSASENSERNQFPWTGPQGVPDHAGPAPEGLTREDDPDVDARYEPANLVEQGDDPSPLAEKARAAAEAARGAGNDLWGVARAHRAVTAGAAAGTAAALALAYGWGHRTGSLAARRDLGPVALLLARRR